MGSLDKTLIFIAADIPYNLKYDTTAYSQQLVELFSKSEQSFVVIRKPIFVPTPFSATNFAKTIEKLNSRPPSATPYPRYKKRRLWQKSHHSHNYGFSGISFCDPRNPLSSTLPKNPKETDVLNLKSILNKTPDLEYVSLKYSCERYIDSIPTQIIALDLSAISLDTLVEVSKFKRLKWLNIGANPLRRFDAIHLPTDIELLLLHKSSVDCLEDVLTHLTSLKHLSLYRTPLALLPTNGVYPNICLLYTSPSPLDRQKSRMPSSA